MNKRLILAGAISIVIAVLVLIASVPVATAMLEKGATNSVILTVSVYRYVGCGLGAVGLVLLLAGLLNKPGK